MLERGEGKQPGAADVLYLSLQVFRIDVFNNTHPPKPLARSRAAVMTIITVITAISLSNIISKNHHYSVSKSGG